MSTASLRFMVDNLLLTSFNSLSVSSEQTAFPKRNLYTNFRSEVFKFKGRFQIISTNKKIYIYDGANKTIALTEGEYTYATLATEIQTKLNASSSNFTVTYDLASGKFTISRTSVWTLRLSQLTDASWETLGWNTIIDLVAPLVSVTYDLTSDERRNHWPSEFIKFDAGLNAQSGFVALVGNLAKDFTISQSATITLKGNTIDDYTTPIISETLPITDLGSFKFFEKAVCRFFKIEITDYLNPLGAEGIEVGNLYIGDWVNFEDRGIDSGFQYTLVDPSIIEATDNGQLYSDVKTLYKSFGGLSIGFLNIANRDFLNDIARRYGTRKPFYLCFDPLLNLSSDLSDLTVFCKFVSVPVYGHVVHNLFSTQFQIDEVV